MSQTNRIILAVVGIIVVVAVVLGVDVLRRLRLVSPDIPAGAIPIYEEGRLIGSFVPGDLEQLDFSSFVDNEEGKTQDGWLLADVLKLYVDGATLKTGSVIVVQSSSREKSVEIPWHEVQNIENMVMLDLSGKGTLKLVSKELIYLDTRDEWVQDVDRIEIIPYQ